MLGRLLAAEGRASKLKIATKANPWSDGHGGAGNLCTAELTRQAEESLSRMGAGAVDIFYLHAPDQVCAAAQCLSFRSDSMLGACIRLTVLMQTRTTYHISDASGHAD